MRNHHHPLRSSFNDISNDKSVWVSMLASAAVTAVVCIAATIVHKKYSPHRSQRNFQVDTYYLDRCHDVRLRLTKPRHSGFRVVALLVLETGEMIFGTNDEPAVSIAGAVCAERAALLSYRIQYMTNGNNSSTNSTAAPPPPPPSIVAVYIVSDHPHQAITPGCLCREYMYGHPAIDPMRVRIVLQSADQTSSPLQVSLCDLYPYPSIFARDCPNVTKAMEISRFHTQNHIDWNAIPPGMSSILWSQIQRLRRASLVYLQTQQDEYSTTSTMEIYPIAYVASILINDNDYANHDNAAAVSEPTIVSATQVPTLEYGCTQDAVCRVLAKISDSITNQNPKIGAHDPSHHRPCSMVLLQMDSNGVPHAPFAAARSLLVEYYHHPFQKHDHTQPNHSFHVIVYDGTKPQLRIVPVAALAPESPQIIRLA
jgi:cytidine deaminase